MRPLLSIRTVLTTVALAVLSACGNSSPESSATQGGGGRGGPGGGRGGPGGGRGGEGQVTPVEIAIVDRVTLSNTSLVTGLLEPIRTVSVNAQLGGALLAMNVEEGSRVREGQVLATIDARELEAQVRAAEAALTFAKATAQRSAELFEKQIVTAAENERDQSALAAAQATATQLKTRLGFSRIVSPIGGVVTARFVQGGDIVSPNTRLFTVSDLSTLVVRLPVSELEVSQLRTGAEVGLSVDALAGAIYPGRIRRIFPAADSVTRLVPVEVAVTGSATSLLRPGYTVRATLKLDSKADALVVPTRAVLGATGARTVYVVRNGLAERRPVRVGADVDGQLEVFSGLAMGDTVIVAGNSLVREGGKVRIVDPLAPDAPSRAAGVNATSSTIPTSAVPSPASAPDSGRVARLAP